MKMPMLRFKADDGSEFPTWEEKKFGDIWKRIAVKNDGSFGGDKIISVANMKWAPKDDVRDDYLRTYNLLPSNAIAFEGNRNNSYPYGRFVLNDIGYGIVSHIFVCFEPIADIIPAFWKEYIHAECVMGKILRKCTKSSTMMHDLVVPDFLKQIIFVPSLSEQRKIADFLSAVDAVIAAQQAEVDAWERRKKGVMQKLFSQEVRFKADDGSDFPDWEEKTLGDLGVFVRGLAYDKTQTVETDGIAVMRSNNIGLDGTLDYENEVRLVSKEPSEKQLLRKNDIVICTANGSRLVGKAAKYDGGYKEPSRITVGAFCGIFRSSDTVLPWWFQSDGYQRFLYSVKQGGNGALTNINGKDIESINVMLPTSIDEQHKIVDGLSLMDEVIQKAKDELAKWRELKKGLLQQMFV